MLTKDTAICIRAIDYSETSQILTFFTRDTGKIGAIAKGSKRPKSSFGGPFEIFSYGKIVFAESNKDKLNNSVVSFSKDDSQPLKESLNGKNKRLQELLMDHYREYAKAMNATDVERYNAVWDKNL